MFDWQWAYISLESRKAGRGKEGNMESPLWRPKKGKRGARSKTIQLFAKEIEKLERMWNWNIQARTWYLLIYSARWTKILGLMPLNSSQSNSIVHQVERVGESLNCNPNNWKGKNLTTTKTIESEYLNWNQNSKKLNCNKTTESEEPNCKQNSEELNCNKTKESDILAATRTVKCLTATK